MRRTIFAILAVLLIAPIVRAADPAPPAGQHPTRILVLPFSMTGADAKYTWIGQAPQSLHRIEGRLRDLKKPVQTVSKATEQVEKIAKVSGGQDSTPKVQVTTESLGARVLSKTTDLVSSAVVMFILLYFLLASGDLFLHKLVKVTPSLEDKKRAVEIARQIETEVSTYLATITLINIVLGLTVWGALALIGVPNPLLWGVLATFANYIPYLGPIVMVSVLTMVGLLTFPDIPHALLPPGAFLVLHGLETFLITPMILGRRLTLNPVMIFLGLTFWGWMWGIAGAILAVPIMVVFKIFCDHIESLAPVGELLGS